MKCIKRQLRHNFLCIAANNLLKTVDLSCFIGGKSAWLIVVEINSR